MKLLMVLLTLCLLFFYQVPSNTFAQSKRARPTAIKRKQRVEMPCGMGIEASLRAGMVGLPEWLLAAKTKEESYYYSTKWVCVDNIVKVWVREVLKDTDANADNAVTISMLHYDSNAKCGKYARHTLWSTIKTETSKHPTIATRPDGMTEFLSRSVRAS